MQPTKMSKLRIRDYKVGELEKIAANILQAHLGPSHSIPIDVDYIAEHGLGVLIDTRPDLQKRFSAPGICWRRGKGQYTIIVDEYMADYLPNFYRFTVAEEVGHIVLHGDVIDKLTSLDDVASLLEWEHYKEMDYHARRFAAAVLMPPFWVERVAQKVYEELAGIAGFGDPEAIKDYLAVAMAKKFSVSEQSMKYRLTQWPMRIYEKVEHALLAQEKALPQ